MKTSMRSMLMALTFLSLAVGPKAQAVSPPPDGGYPGGNTAEGQNALLSLTTGGYNTAVGFFSVRNNTEGSFNTATGAGTLLANSADENTGHWRWSALKQHHRRQKHRERSILSL
jgi:hypothetical protein